MAPPHPQIGVGKAFTSPPSEPCVRFSRTRLSSRWFSSSGVSRVFRSRKQGEQPLIREEGIGPSHMVCFAASHRRPPVLLAQDRSQPPPDEAVENAEYVRPGMLEVAKPPSHQRVQVGNDPSQAIAPAPSRLRPHLVFERHQTLVAHQPTTSLEPESKEVETLTRLLAVADARLVGVQGQAVGIHPRRDLT